MADDVVWVNYSTLQTTSGQLGRIIDALEQAVSASGELREAIGTPFGEGALRNKVGDFESRWDTRRGDLIRDITKIHEHVEGVLNGFSDWDTQTAADMDIDASGGSSSTRPTPV